MLTPPRTPACLLLLAALLLPTAGTRAAIIHVQPGTPISGASVYLSGFDALGVITNNNYGYSVGGRVDYMNMPEKWSAGGIGSYWDNLKSDSYTVANLSAGVTIDGGMPWAGPGGEFTSGSWASLDQAGYMGFRFSLDSGANYRYGWAEVTRHSGAIEVSQMAFTTADGETIKAGQVAAVPEPATWVALAFGMAMLAVCRTRST